MIEVLVTEAGERLELLIEQVLSGEEVFLVSAPGQGSNCPDQAA